jgi:hypothetical protein
MPWKKFVIMLFLVAVSGYTAEAAPLPNVMLEFTVQPSQEDRISPWYHIWHLYCISGKCRLNVLTVGQCSPSWGDDPAKFYPKIETSSTEEGNLEVIELSSNVLHLRQMSGEAVVTARIGYANPLTIGGYTWYTQTTGFSGIVVKQSSILDKVITWELVPLKGPLHLHTVKLACEHILVPGLEQERSESSPPQKPTPQAGKPRK